MISDRVELTDIHVALLLLGGSIYHWFVNCVWFF